MTFKDGGYGTLLLRRSKLYLMVPSPSHDTPSTIQTYTSKALAGFINSICKQGVTGLAIGFVFGGAVAKLVAALVADLVTPVVGLLLGLAKGPQEITPCRFATVPRNHIVILPLRNT
jgi:Large-conductance mechanosensitive channel, MscL